MNKAFTIISALAFGGMSIAQTTIDGHEYVDLGLTSGTLWATCNVGAQTSNEYGDYFAWGETAVKTSYYWESYFDTEDDGESFTKYKNEGGKTQLDQTDDAASKAWGNNWSIPSHEAQAELTKECVWTEAAVDGVKGYIVTSKVNDNYIFLPLAGIFVNAALEQDGEHAYYSSKNLTSNDQQAWFMGNDSKEGFNANRGHSRRDGFSVRPVIAGKNIPADDTPTSIGNNVVKNAKVTKTIEDGHIVIIKDGIKYDLAGRKL